MSPVKEFVGHTKGTFFFFFLRGHTKGTLVSLEVVHVSSPVGVLNLFPPSLSHSFGCEHHLHLFFPSSLFF